MKICWSLVGSITRLSNSGYISLVLYAVFNVPINKPFPDTVPVKVFLALIIGVYDGFYGPGTGTFLMLLLTAVAHVSLNEAAGTTKVINLATNVAALVVFLVHGVVWFPLALIAAVFGIAGNYIGANYFTSKGTGFVKPVIIVVLTIFFIKICFKFTS